MSDLIDRQEAVKALERYSNDSDMPYEWHRGIDAAKEIISAVPTAELKYVRCGECHWNDGVAYCEFHFMDVKGDWFCPWGEKDE